MCCNKIIEFTCISAVFDVVITSTNRSNATVIEYVIGSDANLTCMISPAPPPNSDIRWNCSNDCLVDVEKLQTISLSDIKVREGGIIYCSVSVAGTVYHSELINFRITGKSSLSLVLYNQTSCNSER